MNVMSDIWEEYIDSRVKHPIFPKDLARQCLILTEEAGEVSQAVNDVLYGGSHNIYDVQKELLQTAAMCVRMLISIEKKEYTIENKEGAI